MRNKWTNSDIALAIDMLSESETVGGACARLAAHGIFISPDGLHTALTRHVGRTPSSYLVSTSSQISRSTKSKTMSAEPEDFSRLVKESRKSPTLEQLCNALDLSPNATRDMIKRARESGIALKVGHGNIGIGFDENDEIHDVGVPPTVGETFRMGVISDLHLGSKYCLRREIVDCVGRIYRSGARDILMVGDLLDGCYRHGEFELKYSGIEDQTADLYRTLPQMDGLRYHAITGNHDFTFTEKTGLDVGAYITGHFNQRGRRDIKFYGDRAATLRIGGTTVRMLHPCGSCSYAVSYKLQKFVEAFDSAEKPGILVVGHWHRSCYIYTRGVHAFACPTLQGPGSAFGKSLGLGPQAIGGLLMKWKLTKFKTIRELTFKPISYFKHEKEKEAFGE